MSSILSSSTMPGEGPAVPVDMDAAALARVEEQRLELEGQISQLRKSLRHWQTLEIDYEGLKEEFSLLPEDSSTQKALEAAKDFSAELVDEQEIRLLFGLDKGVRRTLNQVIDLLSKRIDYVSKNALTIKKQLSDAEKKRNALLLAKEPDFRDEAGLPLTEVTEELDDSGNVVSSKLETAKSAAPQLMEVLKLAGVDDLIEKNGVVTTASGPDGNQALNVASQSASLEQGNPSSQVERLERRKVEPTLPETLEEEQNPSPALAGSPLTISAAENRVVQDAPQELSRADQDNGSTLDSLDFPTNPDDTQEDAALRREMLAYAHSEIGPIVAQLELDEGASDVSYDEDDELFSRDSEPEDEEDQDEEASEDEYGQTKNPVISSRYRKKMEELERKLGVKGMQNLGPEPDLPPYVTKDLNKPPAAEAARKAAIERAEAAAAKAPDKEVASQQAPKKSSKKVSFAKDLDIAQETDRRPLIKSPKSNTPRNISEAAVSRSVIERDPTTPPTDSSAASLSQPRKASRFRATRHATSQTPLLQQPGADRTPKSATNLGPAPPVNEVMSADIKERPEPSNLRKTRSPDPYDFDEALHKQEIAREYHKSRNKLIQQQGGFVRDDEDDNYGEFAAPVSVVDEETGKVKKTSRFRAARLR